MTTTTHLYVIRKAGLYLCIDDRGAHTWKSLALGADKRHTRLPKHVVSCSSSTEAAKFVAQFGGAAVDFSVTE